MDSRISWFEGASGTVADASVRPVSQASTSVASGGGLRRVLALVDLASRGDQVIRHARSLSLGGEASLLAVHVLDGRSVFESDGPCGYFLAAERFGSRVPEVEHRLNLVLARNQAAWAESAVLVADSAEPLSGVIGRWKPDRIVTDRRSAAQPWAVAALRRAGCAVDLVDATSAVAARPGRFFELLKGEKLMNDSPSAAADSARARQVAKASVLGLVTLLLYLLLFSNEAALLQLSAQGRWYFVLPIAIAFVFSFFHGAFTAQFWDVLGVKASGKKG
jgi:hypothetical protein